MKQLLKEIMAFILPKGHPWSVKRYVDYSVQEWYRDYVHYQKAPLSKIIEVLNRTEGFPLYQEWTTTTLKKLLSSSNSCLIGVLCIYALYKLEEQGATVENSLINLLGSKEELVRRMAAISLTKIGTVKALSAVVAGHRHGHGIRSTAAEKLAKIGPEALEAVPALLQLLAYPNINWRSHFAGARALTSIGQEAVPMLLEQLKSDNYQLKWYVAEALNHMQPAIEEPLIQKILQQPPP